MATFLRIVPVFFLLLCVPPVTRAHTNTIGKRQKKLNKQYQEAVQQSEYATYYKRWDGLQAIDTGNKLLRDTLIGNERYILVVSWKAKNFYAQENLPQAQPLSSKQYDMWVTVAPELRERMSGVPRKKLDLRLEQLLGLPPVPNYYKLFFEFWVRPQDLYRPCADNEIADNACELDFPAGVTPAHRAWIDSQRISRFFAPKTEDRFPWTQLGYTYDWNKKNKSHHGCSEFVVKRWATIYQRHFYSTEEYVYGK